MREDLGNKYYRQLVGSPLSAKLDHLTLVNLDIAPQDGQDVDQIYSPMTARVRQGMDIQFPKGVEVFTIISDIIVFRATAGQLLELLADENVYGYEASG